MLCMLLLLVSTVGLDAGTCGQQSNVPRQHCAALSRVTEKKRMLVCCPGLIDGTVSCRRPYVTLSPAFGCNDFSTSADKIDEGRESCVSHRRWLDDVPVLSGQPGKRYGVQPDPSVGVSPPHSGLPHLASQRMERRFLLVPHLHGRLGSQSQTTTLVAGCRVCQIHCEGCWPVTKEEAPLRVSS